MIAIDSRGRGHSDHDADHTNYNCMTELGDIVGVLFELGVGPAVFVGSPIGGILTLLLGAAHPISIAAASSSRCGPRDDCKGLARIKSYLGKLPHPQTDTEGAGVLRQLMGEQFPKLTDAQWLGAAQRTWHLKHGGLKPAYDLVIALALAGIDIDRPMPPLRHEFDALAVVPMLIIRGANSDLLSADTLAAMAAGAPRWTSPKLPIRGMPLCSKASWSVKLAASSKSANPRARAPMLRRPRQPAAACKARCGTAASLNALPFEAYQPAL